MYKIFLKLKLILKRESISSAVIWTYLKNRGREVSEKDVYILSNWGRDKEKRWME